MAMAALKGRPRIHVLILIEHNLPAHTRKHPNNMMFTIIPCALVVFIYLIYCCALFHVSALVHVMLPNACNVDCFCVLRIYKHLQSSPKNISLESACSKVCVTAISKMRGSIVMNNCLGYDFFGRHLNSYFTVRKQCPMRTAWAVRCIIKSFVN